MFFSLSLCSSHCLYYALPIIFMLFLISLRSFYYLYALSNIFTLFLLSLCKFTYLFPMSHSLLFYLSLTVCLTLDICCQY
ncbi:hypothetical protein BDB00DRAFT_860731, partial [Zychaea mexicana]|uniref:uncharacterized protein n=1 Tax=Zychaea mexicana TaxID=64656 RepID=UPI0022FF14FB